MTSEAQILDLVDRGLFKDAARAIDLDKAPSLSLQATRAALEIDVGQTARARQLAQSLLNQRLNHLECATCWEVIGRTDLTTGRIGDGLKAMHRAFAAVRLSQDRKREARLMAVNCEALLHWRGMIESAAAELPRLRQAAVSTGDPYSLIAFHSLLAQIKAKKGLLVGAKKSLETCEALLSRWPSAWYSGRIAIVRAAIFSLESNYSAALLATETAREHATKSGSKRILGPALANIAHIKMAQGELDEASQAIEEFLSVIEKGGSAEIAGLDTSLQIALAMGDLERCVTLAETADRISSQVDDGASYHGLWYLLTRIRWMYHVGQVESALTLALGAIPKAQRAADENLLVRLRLLAVEGFGRLNRIDEGASLLRDAVGTNPVSLELLAETSRVCGRLRAMTDPQSAAASYRRAVRIFDAIGNVSARNDTQREAEGTLVAVGATTDAGAAGRHLANAAIWTEQVSALTEFGASPLLLAMEVLALLIESGTVVQAAVVASGADGQAEIIASYPAAATPTDTRAVRIPVGVQNGCEYVLCAVPQPSAPSATHLLLIERLVAMTTQLARSRQSERELSALWPEQTIERQLGLVCGSQQMLDLIKTIRRVAATNVNVLLTGETGVGKELFARALHQASARSDRTFLPFNCATVPRDLFDSQLFGHKRGAFTGAMDNAAGVIRAAAGGTLFLDEIGEMTIETQPKLLRFLESGEILPLGETKPQIVDVRIVAATNAKLDQYVADGRFREDLYYRLNVIRIDIPPLRERREEIPALVEHFLERFSQELQKPMLRVADETLEYLVLYRWPGNVRQLANEIRRLVAMADPGGVLMPAHLSDDLAASRRTVATGSGPRKSVEVVTRIDQSLAAAVEHIERAAIQRAVAVCEGRLDEAAKMLGLSRKGLYLKRQRLHLG